MERLNGLTQDTFALASHWINLLGTDRSAVPVGSFEQDLARAFNGRLESNPASDDLGVALHLAYLIETVARHHPAKEIVPRLTFATTICRAWLKPTRLRLVLTDELVEALERGDRDMLPTHLASSLFDRFTGQALTNRPVDVRRAFISTAMANPPIADLNRLARMASELEWILGSNGVFSFVPALLRDPRADPGASNSGGLLEIDESMMGISDVAILFTHPPANGVGAISRIAAELLVPTYMVVPRTTIGADDGRPPPRLTSLLMDEPNIVIDYMDEWSQTREDLSFVVALAQEDGFLTREHLAERVLRTEEAGERVAYFRREIRSMPAFERNGLSGWGVSKARLDWLLAHPLNFVGAIGLDRLTIEHWLPPHVGTLSAPQQDGLREAQRRGGWDAARSVLLAAVVLRQIARAPAFEKDRLRQDSVHPQFWLSRDELISR
jgi:hypothetical protein